MIVDIYRRLHGELTHHQRDHVGAPLIMYKSNKRLIILDADGTTIDAYSAIEESFSRHGLTLGDQASFQKRHHLFKYLGGLKQFPSIIKKNIRKQSRKQIVATLTEVYRKEAQLYPGIAQLVQTLIAAPDIVVGLVTRNITNEPLETLRQLFMRHDIDVGDLDFLVHIPLGENKTTQFRLARERFDINTARAYICGDEHKDFLAAINAGMHPFMVSYGFEDHMRLTTKFDVPDEVISRTPEELCGRVLHALDLAIQDGPAMPQARMEDAPDFCSDSTVNMNTRIAACQGR